MFSSDLTVQREIGWDTSLTVSYIGNKGSKLFRAVDLNQIIINSNGFLNEFTQHERMVFWRWLRTLRRL